jgi:flavin-dependent dehydrogenase
VAALAPENLAGRQVRREVFLKGRKAVACAPGRPHFRRCIAWPRGHPCPETAQVFGLGAGGGSGRSGDGPIAEEYAVVPHEGSEKKDAVEATGGALLQKHRTEGAQRDPDCPDFRISFAEERGDVGREAVGKGAADIVAEVGIGEEEVGGEAALPGDFGESAGGRWGGPFAPAREDDHGHRCPARRIGAQDHFHGLRRRGQEGTAAPQQAGQKDNRTHPMEGLIQARETVGFCENVDLSAQMNAPSNEETYDAVVIGGALSGASLALILGRAHPARKILVLERSTAFSRRVGEATVEISTYFLGRVLGLTEYLNHEHLNKQGLRFWFSDPSGKDASADACSEVGPGYNVRFPSYQVDRARLDEEVLRRAAEAPGVTVLRPAEAKEVDWVPGGTSTVTYTVNGDVRTARARWVVDASGMARLMARKNRWVVPNERHPIASIWSRWRGIDCIDGRAFREDHPRIAARGVGIRFTATNHLIGRGWWSWWIPLRGGDTSVGIVWDERYTEVAPGASPAERLHAHLCQHPLARDLLKNAEMVPDDCHYRKNLAWRSSRMAGDGLFLVGDAAGFIDPFYSPGMDWISFGVVSAAGLIGDDWAGASDTAAAAERANTDFLAAYDRWFEAIYENKYAYMGDYDLMKMAFRLDLGLYYLGVVSQPYKLGEAALRQPPFTGPRARLPFLLIRAYNRRLARIADARHARGAWGAHNTERVFPFNSYRMDWTLPLRLTAAAAAYARLELTEGWRTLGRARTPKPSTAPVPTSA